MRDYLFFIFVLFSALLVGVVSAYFSIFGITAMFSAAGISILIMSLSLEFSKIAIISLLYTLRKTLKRVFKWVFTTFLILLIGITSTGVFSYLSYYYQESMSEVTTLSIEDDFLGDRIERIEGEIGNIDSQIERIENRIDQLSSVGSTSIEVRDTTSSTGTRSTVSLAEFRAAQERLTQQEEQLSIQEERRQTLSQELIELEQEKREFRLENDPKQVVGPLGYMASVTGLEVDKIAAIFILLFTVILDPLAVCLFLIANIMLEQSLKTSSNTTTKKKEKDGNSEQSNIKEESPKKRIEEVKDNGHGINTNEPNNSSNSKNEVKRSINVNKSMKKDAYDPPP